MSQKKRDSIWKLFETASAIEDVIYAWGRLGKRGDLLFYNKLWYIKTEKVSDKSPVVYLQQLASWRIKGPDK